MKSPRATGANRGDDDPVLSHIDELGYDQLWLMAVDVGDGLTAADLAAARGQSYTE